VITNGKIFTEIQSLSVKAAKTLGLNFGSVDFAELPNGEIMVVEVNGGVMLEKFSQSSKENYEKSLDIYGEAVSLCLKHN
jgi:glutathione synthase/RimK-type ligase-like ATP-grasp enzyme